MIVRSPETKSTGPFVLLQASGMAFSSCGVLLISVPSIETRFSPGNTPIPSKWTALGDSGACSNMQTLIPHAAIGSSQCRGLLYGRVTGLNALIACNDCAVIVRIVPAADLQRVLDDIKLKLDVDWALSRYSQATDLLSPLVEPTNLRCPECGERTRAGPAALPYVMN